MLGMVGNILSIIGWILLIMIFILFCLVMLVLFFPVSYMIKGEKSEKALKASFRLKWLLGICTVEYDYPEPGKPVIKVCGVQILHHRKDKKNDPTKPVKKQAFKEKLETSRQETVSDMESEIKEPNTAKDLSLAEKILFKIRTVCDKIKEIYADLQYYVNVLKDEETKALLLHIWHRVRCILTSIRFRKAEGNLIVGTGSPDTTGYVMAVYGMLSPYLGKTFIIIPDFDHKILEGNFHLKGRITNGILAFHIIKVILDRRLRKFVKKMKREVN